MVSSSPYNRTLKGSLTEDRSEQQSCDLENNCNPSQVFFCIYCSINNKAEILKIIAIPHKSSSLSTVVLPMYYCNLGHFHSDTPCINNTVSHNKHKIPNSPSEFFHKLSKGLFPAVHLNNTHPSDDFIHDFHSFICMCCRFMPVGRNTHEVRKLFNLLSLPMKVSKDYIMSLLSSICLPT